MARLIGHDDIQLTLDLAMKGANLPPLRPDQNVASLAAPILASIKEHLAKGDEETFQLIMTFMAAGVQNNPKVAKQASRALRARGVEVYQCPVCSMVTTKKCARCKQVAYCSKECQASDWANHRPFCQSSNAQPGALV